LSSMYWEALKISRMEGAEFVAPTHLVTYFNLYPPHGIEERGRLARLFLEMSLAHRRITVEVKESLEQIAAPLAKDLQANKEDYEKLKAQHAAK
jgi:hypothetical protein